MSKSSSEKEFAAKIIEVINNPEQAHIVGENARRKIASHYLCKHYLQRLINIYQAALERH